MTSRLHMGWVVAEAASNAEVCAWFPHYREKEARAYATALGLPVWPAAIAGEFKWAYSTAHGPEIGSLG